VITAAEDLFLGAALDSAAPDVMVTAGEEAAPDLRRVLEAAPSGPSRAKQAYELGVELLVEGLRAKLARTQNTH
jgi:hypothetical protein